jgi:hypothetical protein
MKTTREEQSVKSKKKRTTKSRVRARIDLERAERARALLAGYAGSEMSRICELVRDLWAYCELNNLYFHDALHFTDDRRVREWIWSDRSISVMTVDAGMKLRYAANPLKEPIPAHVLSTALVMSARERCTIVAALQLRLKDLSADAGDPISTGDCDQIATFGGAIEALNSEEIRTLTKRVSIDPEVNSNG